MQRNVWVALAMVTMGACARPPAAKEAVPAAPPKPAALSVIFPQPGMIRRVIEQPGSIQPDEETQIVAKLAGYVSAVYVDIGQPVKGPRRNSNGDPIEPGQVLAELSVPEVQEELKQKLALIRQAESEVEQARKAVTATEAAIKSAESFVVETKAALTKAQALYDRWHSEAERVASLVTSGVIDAQSRDETNNQFKAAEAGRNEAQARVASAEAGVRKAGADAGKAEADVKAVAAKVDVCHAEARRVEAILGYARIRAPFDGVVTSRKVNTGDLLITGGNRTIFTIARLDPVRAIVQVPEADAGLIETKMKVDFTVPVAQSPTKIGSIARTSWSLEPASRTLRVEVDLPNADGRLRPGMYVNARIAVDISASWVIPATAVIKQADSAYCFLVVDGKAVKVSVVTGRTDGQRVEILRWKRDLGSISSTDRVVYPASATTEGQLVPTSPRE